jgi:hypothetical protein
MKRPRVSLLRRKEVGQTCNVKLNQFGKKFSSPK